MAANMALKMRGSAWTFTAAARLVVANGTVTLLWHMQAKKVGLPVGFGPDVHLTAAFVL